MYKDNQERIDAYLRGEMTADQRHLFESEMEVNEELRNEYWLTKAIVNAIADRQEKLKFMRRWSEEDEMEEPYMAAACAAAERRIDQKVAAINPKFRILRWVYGIGAAACIAVGIFAVKSIFFASAPTDGNYMMPDFGTEAIYRAGNSDISSVDSLIAGKQYALALSSVDSFINETNEYLKGYEETDSMTERDRYKIELNKGYLYELEWRKIHLLLALNKKDDAMRRLIRFSPQEGAYKTKADSLLETLKLLGGTNRHPSE